MKNGKTLTRIAASILMACGTAQQVSAELYVSPVVRKSVTYNVDKVQKDIITSSVESVDFNDSELVKADNSTKIITGVSESHGDFIIKEEEEKDVFALMNAGKNVPLFVAMEKVVPESNDWFIHLDDGLENIAISWRGGNSWEGVLESISEQNNISIKINHEERAIGVSRSKNISEHLAKQVPDVWRLQEGVSLRKNLDNWSQRAGWRLHWDEEIESDFQIEHSAILTGEFVGEGGVVERALDSLRNSKKPLKPKFYKINNVLYITEAGYKQEVLY